MEIAVMVWLNWRWPSWLQAAQLLSFLKFMKRYLFEVADSLGAPGPLLLTVSLDHCTIFQEDLVRLQLTQRSSYKRHGWFSSLLKGKGSVWLVDRDSACLRASQWYIFELVKWEAPPQFFFGLACNSQWLLDVLGASEDCPWPVSGIYLLFERFGWENPILKQKVRSSIANQGQQTAESWWQLGVTRTKRVEQWRWRCDLAFQSSSIYFFGLCFEHSIFGSIIVDNETDTDIIPGSSSELKCSFERNDIIKWFVCIYIYIRIIMLDNLQSSSFEDALCKQWMSAPAIDSHRFGFVSFMVS